MIRKISMILAVALLLPALFIPPAANAGPVQDKAAPVQVAAATQSPATNGLVALTGAINGNLPIHMSLKIDGSGKLTGSYYYDKYKTAIKLAGDVSGKQVNMYEYDAKGKKTGYFEGWWISGTGFNGVWSNPDGTRQLPVEVLTAKAAAAVKVPAAAEWSGEWYMPSGSPFYGAYAEFSNVKSDKLTFTVDAFNGAHSGSLGEESAVVRKRMAVYKEEDGSVVFFYLLSGKLYVTSPAPVYSAGANVTYTGEYTKGSPKDVIYTLKDTGVFKTAAEDKAFRKVTGDDYDLFLYSMQLLNEPEDLDNLGAMVVSGGVRGLFTITEAIIMHDAKGRYWAAVLDSDDENEQEGIAPTLVRFYTNVPGTTKLPKTIVSWMEGFSDYEVVFMTP
ncbi:hypothetical protein [Paenibacillus sp. MMS20-IR301]|uniref:hypothetical protein n=1 Tax=Paenibacillus sp. MMS20-IR301 TaxID=2895946 RepID=UPI0028EFE67D|nr:hypothetical protein [Paenibacillus sp. MMS20-IR301]WNS43900.1 hypothetical protein LOS79_01145 [Paenibacillus sp. MMS20-IR301]